MKTIILFAVITAIVTFMSCSKNENEVLSASESVLNIQTNVEGVKTRANITAFPLQSSIGLFVTNGSLGSNYGNVVANANVKSLYNGSSWNQTPSVYLSSTNATIFAYYPYLASNNDGTCIPIEHNSQTDYLYGTHSAGHAAVNNGSPNVNLTLKHALSLIEFKFSKSNYPGTGNLTKIEICNNTGKKSLCSEGSMNISTGAITYNLNKNMPASYNLSETIPVNTSVLVMPVTSVSTAGDIKMNFTIDGKTYSYPIPAGTKWEQGKSNIYTVTLSGTGLIINNVGITDWTMGNNGSVVIR